MAKGQCDVSYRRYVISATRSSGDVSVSSNEGETDISRMIGLHLRFPKRERVGP